jgi:hypothetical protein
LFGNRWLMSALRRELAAIGARLRSERRAHLAREHFQEKREPVFRPKMRQTKRERTQFPEKLNAP